MTLSVNWLAPKLYSVLARICRRHAASTSQDQSSTNQSFSQSAVAVTAEHDVYCAGDGQAKCSGIGRREQGVYYTGELHCQQLQTGKLRTGAFDSLAIKVWSSAQAPCRHSATTASRSRRARVAEPMLMDIAGIVPGGVDGCTPVQHTHAHETYDLMHVN